MEAMCCDKSIAKLFLDAGADLEARNNVRER